MVANQKVLIYVALVVLIVQVAVSNAEPVRGGRNRSPSAAGHQCKAPGAAAPANANAVPTTGGRGRSPVTRSTSGATGPRARSASPARRANGRQPATRSQ